MSRSAQHWRFTKDIRQSCFIEGFLNKDHNPQVPYKFGSYQYKEFMNGKNKRMGYEDYPNWNCVYKTNTDGYRFYKIGFEQKEKECLNQS
jgi:hypothetical protein